MFEYRSAVDGLLYKTPVLRTIRKGLSLEEYHSVLFGLPTMPFSHLGEGSVFVAHDPESETAAVFVKTGEVAVRFTYAGIKLPNSIKVRGSMFDEPVAKYCALQPSAEIVFKRSSSVRLGQLEEVHVLEYRPPPPPSALPGHPLFEEFCMDR